MSKTKRWRIIRTISHNAEIAAADAAAEAAAEKAGRSHDPDDFSPRRR